MDSLIIIFNNFETKKGALLSVTYLVILCATIIKLPTLLYLLYLGNIVIMLLEAHPYSI